MAAALRGVRYRDGDRDHAGARLPAASRRDVPVLLVTGARSALLTPAQARARGSLMPHAEVAVVPGSHGGFNRVGELNDRIAGFIQAHAADGQPAQSPTAKPAGPQPGSMP